MLTYTPNNDNDHIILFGTSGWSSYFMASFEKLDDRIEKSLWSRAQRLTPDAVKNSHPDNAHASWMRIYKFNKELKHDDV